MTCIVGCIDKEKDCVWIGCDSLGSNGYSKSVQQIPKAFRNVYFDNIIMGSTTSFRHIDLLMYSEDIFTEIDYLKKTDIDHKYMVTKFIPRLRNLFNDGIVSEDEKRRGANFIIGVGNKLFEVQEDYSVLVPNNGYCAVGCGYLAALGSMATSAKMDLSVPERIELALNASEQCVCGVQRPFRIIDTLDDKEIVIN